MLLASLAERATRRRRADSARAESPGGLTGELKNLLAYVFSHHAAPGTDVTAYEHGLRRFHASLAQAGPRGFISSATYRSGGNYSDWYLVEDSAALDPLNTAAVAGSIRPAHDAVARSATDTAGKLYVLVKGRPDGQAFETRFSKPAGMGYDVLYERLERWTAIGGVSLWRRMMVLGPPPEFCLLSSSDLDLPAELNPEVLSREPV